MESAGEYDYVIVGAGIAGCLLDRLVRRPAARVLPIEAGREDCLWIRIPAGYLYRIAVPQRSRRTSSARRKAGDSLALVDSRQRVHGVAALRVVDATVMPWITSGNMHSPARLIRKSGAASPRRTLKETP
jgi:choline dehydrogenase-like flavoprotein